MKKFSDTNYRLIIYYYLSADTDTDLLNEFIPGPMKRHYLLERKREPQVRL